MYNFTFKRHQNNLKKMKGVNRGMKIKYYNIDFASLVHENLCYNETIIKFGNTIQLPVSSANLLHLHIIGFSSVKGKGKVKKMI